MGNQVKKGQAEIANCEEKVSRPHAEIGPYLKRMRESEEEALAVAAELDVAGDVLLSVEKRLLSAERKFKQVKEESGFEPDALLEYLKEVYKGEWIAKKAKTEFRITSYNVCYTKLLRKIKTDNHNTNLKYENNRKRC